MRLSESLRRNILETTVGGVINKFKIRRRRTTLFFEDVLANYIKACEGSGYENKMRKIAEKWSGLAIGKLTPAFMKRLPIRTCLDIAKRIWTNIGLLDDLSCETMGKTLRIRTKNEYITRIIGKNQFAVGAYTGILNVITNREITCLKAEQSRKESEYVFKIEKNIWMPLPTKEMSEYMKLNQMPKGGFSLKDAIKRGIISVKRNNIVNFRGKSLIPVENTVFHLLGNAGFLMEDIPEIAREYFAGVVKSDADETQKLLLLKTILQVMGWGALNITRSEGGVTVTMENPPYGLQTEEENWNIIAQTILGYLWLIDKKFRLGSTDRLKRRFKIEYTIG